jgi:copper chaperone NosL
MTRGLRALGSGLWALAAIACASGPPPPAPLDTGNDACRFCRMAVSNRRFAAQLAAPSEEAMFFDDIGCLRDFLKQQESLPSGTIAYVADHRTGEWVAAAQALYTKSPGVATPMASGLIAHRDVASRDQDQAARGGTPVPAADILGPLARRSSR